MIFRSSDFGGICIRLNWRVPLRYLEKWPHTWKTRCISINLKPLKTGIQLPQKLGTFLCFPCSNYGRIVFLFLVYRSNGRASENIGPCFFVGSFWRVRGLVGLRHVEIILFAWGFDLAVAGVMSLAHSEDIWGGTEKHETCQDRWGAAHYETGGHLPSNLYPPLTRFTSSLKWRYRDKQQKTDVILVVMPNPTGLWNILQPSGGSAIKPQKCMYEVPINQKFQDKKSSKSKTETWNHGWSTYPTPPTYPTPHK